jgi:glucuronoarabinoxylan endo-1,4-beta-xylanase
MHFTQFRNLAAITLAAALLIAPSPARAQAAGSINFTSTQQVVNGFGFSDAFGEANTLKELPTASQTAILNLLFSRQSGAGFSILRVGIDTDSYIEPNSPGTPSATPAYTFDGSDGGQVWLSQNGQKYGLNNFYADAWTAPAFMKTNKSLDNGGYLCGEIGETCATGDWRTAYANFLLQYVKFYRGVGIPIGNLGFVNEPDLSTTYQSMLFTAPQAVDFVKVIGPVIQSSGLPLNLFCCDGSKWSVQTPFTQAIVADPVASSYVNVISSHEYGSHATSPQPTTKPVWMTEWSSSNGTFEALWDCDNCSGGPDGMYLANDIIQAFNSGNVNAYLYWWGTSSGAAALILTTPPNYTVAGRFYAIASFSRFVRPGAFMVSSTNSNSNLNVVAFLNTDGSKVFGVINTAFSAIDTSFTVDPGTANSMAKTYLTDSTSSLAETDSASVSGQTLNLSLPARSLTMVTLPPTIVAGTVQLITTTSVAQLGDGSYEATVTISNNGTGTVQNLQLTGALLGSASGTPAPGMTLPQSLGNIGPGGSLTTALNFPSSAGAPSALVIARFAGSYTGGTFGGSARIVLP